MGEDLGNHGELESWSDLKLLDLTFNFLSRKNYKGTKARDYGEQGCMWSLSQRFSLLRTFNLPSRTGLCWCVILVWFF